MQSGNKKEKMLRKIRYLLASAIILLAAAAVMIILRWDKWEKAPSGQTVSISRTVVEGSFGQESDDAQESDAPQESTAAPESSKPSEKVIQWEKSEGSPAPGKGKQKTESAEEVVTDPEGESTEETVADREGESAEEAITEPEGESVHGQESRSSTGQLRETMAEEHDGTGNRTREYLLAVILVCIALCLLAIAAISASINKLNTQKEKEREDALDEMKKSKEPVRNPESKIRIGRVHNIGKRPSQQDCLGKDESVPDRVFAVVADGMGGLSGGDKVSQCIVRTMLNDIAQIPAGEADLKKMVLHANEEVNRMLGECGLYKSGSTVVAVFMKDGKFCWVSVGDSRVYLYRDGQMLQLNREHTLEQELMRQVAKGELTLEEVEKNPKKHGLTSFIGMGELRSIDCSVQDIVLKKGDRVLLMSDGVFNTLSEEMMSSLLQQNEDPEKAAVKFEEMILKAARPTQDNFTAIIMAYA